MFTVVFSILGLIFKGSLGLNSYGAAFWYFLIFGEGLGLFDLLVIDLLWRRNTKRIRFSFLSEKEAYQNPEKHVGSFLRGILLFAAVRHSSYGSTYTGLDSLPSNPVFISHILNDLSTFG